MAQFVVPNNHQQVLSVPVTVATLRALKNVKVCIAATALIPSAMLDVFADVGQQSACHSARLFARRGAADCGR
jgi:hypothetical protein